MLYLVATPIGHLKDFSQRAIETLLISDYILCEDTRHSKFLLDQFKIDRPLKSYHQFNEAAREEEVIADLLQGKSISLISDAGTPGISDPGARIVQSCIAHGIAVVPIPGPCAAICALIASGLDTSRFQFIGFLPKKAGELREALLEILSYSGTSICYESPHRIKETLGKIVELDPGRHIVIARELTKKFEEFIRGGAADLVEQIGEERLRGEITLLIAGGSLPENNAVSMTSEEEALHLVETEKIPLKEAVKRVAKKRGVSRRELYAKLHRDA